MEETCLGLIRAAVPLRQPGRKAIEAIGSQKKMSPRDTDLEVTGL